MTNPQVKMKSIGYLPTLDGWRAFAVMAVIFSHVILPANFIRRVPHWFLTVKSGGGEKGVQLFFAISGFLITTRLIVEWNRFGRISLKTILCSPSISNSSPCNNLPAGHCNFGLGRRFVDSMEILGFVPLLFSKLYAYGGFRL